jgi:stage II sporulation protein GA (sporulation sigma-E factor processing peptidase)
VFYCRGSKFIFKKIQRFSGGGKPPSHACKRGKGLDGAPAFPRRRQKKPTQSDTNKTCPLSIMRKRLGRGVEKIEIYADILILINLTVNYFLLLAAGGLCGRRPGRLRVFFSAFAGAFYSLVIFIPQPQPVLLALSKLLTAVLMVETAFPHVSLRQSLREYLVFFGVNFLFAGFMLAVWLIASPPGMIFSGGVLYFPITPTALILSALGAYFLTELLARARRKTELHRRVCPVRIRIGAKELSLRGMSDTGNDLKDAVTGLPVAVCSLQALEPAAPPELMRLLDAVFSGRSPEPGALSKARGFRMVPYHSLGKRGAIPAFFPDDFLMFREGRWERAERMLLGVAEEPLSSGEYQVIFSPSLDTAECGEGLTLCRKGKRNERVKRNPVSLEQAVEGAAAAPSAGTEHLLHQRFGEPASSPEPRGGKGDLPEAGEK